MKNSFSLKTRRQKKLIQKVKFYHHNHDGLEKLALLAYILITVKSGSERDFLKQISEFKEVVEANLVIGENDVVIKIDVKDIAQIDKFLTDKLRVLPDVFLTTTMIITEQFKPKT
ncbi:MAG: Lrp/AsnC ligand binding domain-containing protein [Candidatus Bathyarchaeota archaeon]